MKVYVFRALKTEVFDLIQILVHHVID